MASWSWSAPVIGIAPARRYRAIIELRCELAEQLENPVRLRMASDVPLGAFLSGGGDSFAVVAMMARIGGGTVKISSKRVFG
jgi:asparagine synthase (glutamine-hydrolysing)